MLRSLLCCLALVAWDDPAPAPKDPVDPPSPKAEADAAEARSLARYNEQVEKIPDNAEAHWKLALWCEQNKLRPEAYIQLGRVVELDPKRESAWRKLGFKRHEGRWMTAAQIAAEDAQKAAEKTWTAQLKKWHRAIHGGKDPGGEADEARSGLDKLTDPAAAGAIWREFSGGSGADQEIAVQLLGQVRAPVASKGLAMLALYGKTPEVRRAAMETLRRRPAGEFLDLLVSLMKDPIRYEVRPVGGPGSPGELLIEGERADFRRLYAPPTVNFNPGPGERIGFDEFGNPVLIRTSSRTIIGQPQGVPGSKRLVTEKDQTITTTQTISFANAIAEARRAAMSAQAQLQADVDRIEALNKQRKKLTEMVIDIAREATGKDPGPSAKDWKAELEKVKEGRYARRPREQPRPFVGEIVPLDYVPNLAATIQLQSQARTVTRTFVDT